MEKNKISQIGLKMMNWHASMGDPVYAVGSFMFGGKLHDRPTTERALANIETDIVLYDSTPDPLDVLGWTENDREELGEISRGLTTILAQEGF